ncbi:bifunctional glutamate/proline--tRNA ligase-like [Littorina saxatilis]|uniref:bifunctional glutamate/proline--tRNA ligase-like n=1 Tax=Littorina saxatilis TaxID=31220 RepID=UPI0038B42A2A
MENDFFPKDEQPPQQVGSAAVNDLDNQIRAQGEQVRQLKTNKAPKDEQPPQQVGSAAVNDLDNQIRAQGEQVRQLKTNKAPKDEQPPQQVGSAAVNDLDNQIRAQGEQVRQLKTNKAPKEEVTAAVQTLLSLKKQDKETTGKDWTPPTPGSAPAQTLPTASAGGDLDAKIKEQGDKVRQVKANKAPKKNQRGRTVLFTGKGDAFDEKDSAGDDESDSTSEDNR